MTVEEDCLRFAMFDPESKPVDASFERATPSPWPDPGGSCHGDIALKARIKPAACGLSRNGCRQAPPDEYSRIRALIVKHYRLTALLVAAALALPATAGAKLARPTDKDTATAAAAGPPPVADSPAGDKSTPTPPSLPGFTAYVLMDATTGTVLAEAAPTLQVPPASLVKLMTAHIAFQAIHHGSLKLDQTVPVSPDAWKAGGSRMFIDPTSVVTVDQLLHGLIIDSGNDAAVALAEQIAGSQDAFVQLMTKQAGDLGLADTTYVNVTGLPDPALHTTAMDVAKLTPGDPDR